MEARTYCVVRLQVEYRVHCNISLVANPSGVWGKERLSWLTKELDRKIVFQYTERMGMWQGSHVLS